ncbi:hypothetical protein Kalk_00400 [Ketobacter alkanivorans]|uniref:Uncharacterized protein n=1 Tax=Ketobacter alkanivorans TaxID=1917421 RepID=A0A2K9LJN5_9GAMM|nr:hypothetical protein Kalk_00400 [Ketobacter alkanivorans]
MDSKEFTLKRIGIYAGKEIDPDSNVQVQELLRSKFNIHLPQRKSFDESLASTISDHEIISLILKYRGMK